MRLSTAHTGPTFAECATLAGRSAARAVSVFGATVEKGAGGLLTPVVKWAKGHCASVVSR